MADNIDLDQLHDAILTRIREQFPDLQTVEDYGADRKDLLMPAVLLELVDMEADPDSDPGTEQLAVVTKWAARVVFSFRQENLKREIRKLAGALGVLVHDNRWGQSVNPAKVTVIGPDAFDPAFDNFEVWAVEWDQQVDLGASVWTGEGVTPERVMVGYSPDTGPGQDGAYTELDSTA
ncbi:hypothetical protein [Parasedimentitalea psychrophila]|uniref:Uncharacterized protein n=1 Tax=Parasedimentitalea psychrophila TaxID=2997337 RepID=A0A9Y2KWF9_9RHOB|nr:hypothetical protein [Parasedimentitalea psychrophila]WIY23784.1 hypothetical protein QPJ95_14150 [Parasedimentitalea psychrophila]